jgi:hypothetical protein
MDEIDELKKGAKKSAEKPSTEWNIWNSRI